MANEAMEDSTPIKGAILKSLMVFASSLLEDLGEMCQVDTSRDWKTVTGRVEHEGLSFLTITLADFGKSVEKSIDHGKLLPSFFGPSWGFKGGVPRFLGGFLELMFNRDTGTLLSVPDESALFAVRQFSLAFGKIGVDCSDERTTRAINKYIQCEQELRRSDRSFHDDSRLDFDRMARLLWTNVLGRVDRRVYLGDFRPKHGPGATADKLKGNLKFTNVTWTQRLEDEFPFVENGVASYSQYIEMIDSVKFLEPGAEIPVKVITVPKTLKTPRIIAVEPTHMQYMQQALLELIEEEIRKDNNSMNFLCYDSQIPNQEMARRGASDRSLATLDLSEASDRVSNEHVRQLLSHTPHLFRSVDACRSRKARVLDKVSGLDQTIRLAKFASMGSALCFPMEAFVFTTVVFLGIQKSLGYQLTQKDIKSFYGRVRVYGDDIIVPTNHASIVAEVLESYGFKVNRDKSFWTGMFRESCGKEYFNKTDVSISRVRSMPPVNNENVKELVSWSALRNQLAKFAFTRSVGFIDELISSMIPYPRVRENSPILGRIELSGIYDVHRHDRNTQRPLVRGVLVTANLPENSISGWHALLKHYLKRSVQPFADVEHLIRSGRPVRVDKKYRYASPY